MDASNVVQMNPAPAIPATGPAPGITAIDPCSHVANAQRCVREFKDRLLYVDGIGWHTWGPPWKHDPHGAAELVHGLGRIVYAEAAVMADWVAQSPRNERDEREAAMVARFRWAKKCELAVNIEATLSVARPYFVANAEDMDANPGLVGCRNGVLDLQALAFREHRQADRITKTTGCDCDPDASGDAWRRFVLQVFGDDAELAEWFQRFVGYCLSGHRNEHLLPIFWGGGSNGKSTLLGALQAMFGDYADTAAETLLMQKAGGQHPTQIAALHGKRFVVASETEENGRLNEERVKSLTGGDRLHAHRMHQDGFTFTPTHQLVLQTNHRPKVAGTDYGLWRRLRLVPFTRTFNGDERDAGLPEKLATDLPGILKWAVEGWTNYRAHGLADSPKAVQAATDEYRAASDVIGEFIEQRCIVAPEWSAKARELYHAYTAWCDDTGERPKTQTEFGTRLGERGFSRVKAGTVFWRGLKVAA